MQSAKRDDLVPVRPAEMSPALIDAITAGAEIQRDRSRRVDALQARLRQCLASEHADKLIAAVRASRPAPLRLGRFEVDNEGNGELLEAVEALADLIDGSAAAPAVARA